MERHKLFSNNRILLRKNYRSSASQGDSFLLSPSKITPNQSNNDNDSPCGRMDNNDIGGFSQLIQRNDFTTQGGDSRGGEDQCGSLSFKSCFKYLNYMADLSAMEERIFKYLDDEGVHATDVIDEAKQFIFRKACISPLI